jgi:hypothetical protein
MPYAALMAGAPAPCMALVAGKYEVLAEVRGRGLMIGMEFGKPSGLMARTRWNALQKTRPACDGFVTFYNTAACRRRERGSPGRTNVLDAATGVSSYRVGHD